MYGNDNQKQLEKISDEFLRSVFMIHVSERKEGDISFFSITEKVTFIGDDEELQPNFFLLAADIMIKMITILTGKRFISFGEKDDYRIFLREDCVPK
jgi:hypothetical protein